MKKSRVVIFILVCVAFIVGCFYYVAHKKPSDSADNYELSEVEKVITKEDAAGENRTWCSDCWESYDDIMGR